MGNKSSMLDRRGLLRAAAWIGTAVAGFMPTATSFAAGPESRLDAREGRTTPLTPAEMTRFKPLAKGLEAESFAVVLGNGERHLFRVSGGKTGAATIETVGPRGQYHSTSIMEGDSPLPYLEKKQAELTGPGANLTCGGFWDCFFPCMIAKIGAGVWNNLKNNWANCWNKAMGKRFWYQKVAAFTLCVFTLPYGSYAMSCLYTCK